MADAPIESIGTPASNAPNETSTKDASSSKGIPVASDANLADTDKWLNVESTSDSDKCSEKKSGRKTIWRNRKRANRRRSKRQREPVQQSTSSKERKYFPKVCQQFDRDEAHTEECTEDQKVVAIKTALSQEDDKNMSFLNRAVRKFSKLQENNFGVNTIDHNVSLHNQIFASLNEQRSSGMLCDLVLVTDDNRTINAHKAVLAAASPFFHAMFAVDMVESKNNKITMHGIDFTTLEEIIHYIYSGLIQVDAENLIPTMFAANFFQLNDLTESCAELLKNHLSPTNTLYARAVCSALNCRLVVEEIEESIDVDFLSICDSDAFLELTIEDLVVLLSRDTLNIDKEDSVCKAALRWVDYDPQTRKEYVPRILKCIRLQLLEPAFLAQEVGRHPLVRGNPESRDMVEDAKDFHLLQCRISSPQPGNRRKCPRSPYFFVAGGASGTDEVEIYNPVGNETIALPNMTKRMSFGMATYNDMIYIVGGHNGEESRPFNSMQKFDFSSLKWTTMPNMPTPRAHLSVAVLGSKLYACGGSTNRDHYHDRTTPEVTSTVEVFDFQRNMWATAPSMSIRRKDCAVAVLNDVLYVIGGHGDFVFESVERFCAAENRWERAPSMELGRRMAAATTLNNKIYVCGGDDGREVLNTVIFFDPVSNCWSYAPPMQVARKNLSVLSYNNTIYAIGGENASTTLRSVEYLREGSSEWKFAEDLETYRTKFSAAILPIELNT
ncbi:unnamed protein product [Cylicocyclus nassatus]|uniref:BTB domain-containing protein n=1 Tax=Cylicocyclus nassatus TaxID=53992 RepID=A0AA36DVC7_CYLNA|nr:unnamed protein product [Cylicocyclus nassatus]